MQHQTLFIWWQERFHRSPWNCWCLRNWHTPSSMEFYWTARFIEIGEPQVLWKSIEFHGTARVIQIGAPKVPWNFADTSSSMEFHWIPWNCSCQRNWRTSSSMAFHGIPRNCSCQRNLCTPRSIEFHEISRNCSGHRNWRTPSSMEFHGMPWYCSGQRNWRTLSSMEIHGTARVIEIGALRVLWNSFFLLFNGTIGIIYTLSFKFG